MNRTIYLLTTLFIFLGFGATAYGFPVFVERENVPVEKQSDQDHAKQNKKQTNKDVDKKQNTPAKSRDKPQDRQ